ncbi:MAG: two-component system sensor histidine kinase NtrB [Myxococcota bacterium]
MTASLRPTGSELQRRLQWLMGGRLVVATILLGGTLLLSAGASLDPASFTPQFLQILIAGTYAASFVFALWLPRAAHLQTVAATQIGWDLLVTTGLVSVSGGAASGFTFLYGINILMAAIVLGSRGVGISAAVALLLYTSVGVSLANGWIPPPPDQLTTHYQMPTTELGSAVLANVVGLVLVGLLAGNLSLRLRRTGGQLRRAEKSAAHLAQLNEDIVRSISSGLVTADLNGRVRTINPAAAEMFRTSEKDLLGRALHDLLPVGPTAMSDDPSAAGAVSRAEARATRPDGTHFPIGYSRTPLVGSDGRVMGTLVTFQDLTEIRELRRAAEQAERLAVLGRLSAGLAHEIRNPLSSISGSVELVRDSSALNDEDRGLLNIVLSEVERLDDLVTTMMQVGRPRAPDRRIADLNALAADVVAMARRGPAAACGVEIALDAPAEPIEAAVDPDHIRQVLWNLVKNAIQASTRGERVQVGLSNDDGRPVIEVIDRGKGIAPTEQEKLFDMFYSGRPHGVGLGLALVKQIVDAHGGDVQVDSRTGEGTTFRVVLPATGAVAEATPEARA